MTRHRRLTLIALGVSAAALAACGAATSAIRPSPSPTARTATPIPTLAPTPTVEPTPIAPPTATPTPTRQRGVTLTETCSNIWEQWAMQPYPSNAIMATVTWHNLTVGDYLNIGLAGDRITSSTTSIPPFGPDIGMDGWTQGSWEWSEWSADYQTETAAGTLTIPACPGKTLTPPPVPTPTPFVQYPPPQITAACWPNATQYAWTVILSNQPGQSGANGGHAYDFDYSTNGTTWTTFNGGNINEFHTDRSAGNTLYVRWSADPNSSTSQRARTTPCGTVTVTTTCSTSYGDGSVTFTGVTVGDELHVGEDTDNIPVTANPTILSGLVPGFYYYQGYMSDGVTEYFGGNFTIALCPGSK